jgi:hypothetical protein
MAATLSSSQSQIDVLDRDLCFVLMKGKMYTQVSCWNRVETLQQPSVYIDDERVDVIQNTCRSDLRLNIGFLILPS